MSDAIEGLLAPDALRIVFQPIFELTQGNSRLWALEALARGPAGTHLEAAPVLFDYVRLKREESRIDRRCTAEAISRVAALGNAVPLVTINVHASTLERDRGFGAFFESVAVASDLDPAHVIIEIVEQGHYFAAARLGAALAEMRALGVRIAVDDLGHGNGNYRTVLDVRPEFLKIDRYFVHGAAADPHRRALLRSVIQIAEDFSSTVIAEGIESPEDLAVVTDLGVTLVQGYLLGRPDANPNLTPFPTAVFQQAATKTLRSLA